MEALDSAALFLVDETLQVEKNVSILLLMPSFYSSMVVSMAIYYCY